MGEAGFVKRRDENAGARCLDGKLFLTQHFTQHHIARGKTDRRGIGPSIELYEPVVPASARNGAQGAFFIEQFKYDAGVVGKPAYDADIKGGIFAEAVAGNAVEQLLERFNRRQVFADLLDVRE
jgi:hypothetical protein